MNRSSHHSLSRWRWPRVLRWIHQLAAQPLVHVALGSVFACGPVYGGDILRGGATGSSSGAGAASGPAPLAATPVPRMITSQADLLARTTQALAAVRAMQAAAHAAAESGPNHLRADLPAVPVNSYGQANGLVLAPAVPKDLLHPAAGEDPTLWTGAALPVQTTQTSNGTTTSTVTIQQTQQQALLNWQSFNIGKNTTLDFDQSAGGDNVGEWIAFNKVGVTGNPSQILGSIQAQGQVYVINPNGIIFGGSSQVNTHALVASSLPINDNLVQQGLLNNPDTQFLFSALPQAAGPNGTPLFTPVVTDSFQLGAASSYTLSRKTVSGGNPAITVSAPGTPNTLLVAGADYTVNPVTADGSTSVTFSASGLAKAAGSTLNIAYTPRGDQYGDVEVLAGAHLSAPTSAANVGGRVALIGSNVANAGTIETPDGQAILAAGLQVAFAAHPATDPSLRGLDVYVGAVQDPSLTAPPRAGTAANEGAGSSDSTASTGLIEAPRGDVTVTGRAVNQLGFIDSTTSVSENGRIDLLADYGAAGSGAPTPNLSLFIPFQTGSVTLGSGSVTRILPADPDPANPQSIIGTSLALPSLINLRGLTVHLAAAPANNLAAVVLAPSANIPISSQTAIRPVDNMQQLLPAGVTVNAGTWHFTGALGLQGEEDTFLYPGGQIYLDAGTTIDVSGSVVANASVAENIVSAQLLGTELANSPLQRNGPLHGQTVQVDVTKFGSYNGQEWVGTPLADVSGYVNLIKRSVGELTVAGGSVALNAGGSVVMQPGSLVNVAGGQIDYQGASVNTTKLLSGGHIYDISQATPDRVYDGIDTGTTTTVDSKWGVSQSTASSLAQGTYEPGYVQGGSAGSISIKASAMALDGLFQGQTVAGALQRLPNAQIQSLFGATTVAPTMESILATPRTGSLALDFSGNDPTTLGLASPTPPAITVQASTLTPAGAFQTDAFGNPLALPVERQKLFNLSPDWIDTDGFGNLVVANPDGSIAVPTGVSLSAAPGGSIQLTGATITIGGNLSAPAGTLTFSTLDFDPFQSLPPEVIPAVDSTRGRFVLGSGATLSTAGLVIEDRDAAIDPGSAPLFTSGGSISVAALQTVLNPGSTVDVSGGAEFTATNKPIWGGAGALSIRAQDPKVPNVGQSPLGSTGAHGSLALGATLLGYSGSAISGGALTIVAPLIQIGGSQLLNGDASPDSRTLWINRTDAEGNLLAPDFFSQGGFSSFDLSGLGAPAVDASGNVVVNKFAPAFLVAPASQGAGTGQSGVLNSVATVIDPQVSSWTLAATSAGATPALMPQLLPAALRPPVRLSFIATGVSSGEQLGSLTLNVRGDLVVGKGARVMAGPLGTVALSGDTVAVEGAVSAPGGSIAISGGRSAVFQNLTAGVALPTVDLGPQSALSTAGTTVLTPDPRGLRTGTVLNGGSITVSGNIVAEAGAKLDVSGATDELAVPSTESANGAAPGGSLGGASYVVTREDSNGGSITLSGAEELFSDATLAGAAGGPAATGGSLSVSSGRINPSPTALDPTLILTQGGPTIPSVFFGAGQNAIGNPVLAKDGKTLLFGLGYFAADSFDASGLAALTLKGTVEFSGPVSVTASSSLAVATSGVLMADPKAVNSSLDLNAPYVAIGQALRPPAQAGDPAAIPFTSFGLAGAAPVYFAPTYGSGFVRAAGRLIDVGNLSLQNIGNASLVADGGDIRGDGTLDIQGTLALTAGQVYVPTASAFTVAAYDYRPPTTGGVVLGSVTVNAAGSRPLPWSAGGQLNVFATAIAQNGVLRAPLGRINLGWDGTGRQPWVDPMVGTDASGAPRVPLPVTQTLALGASSVTATSALDPVTGTALTLPYGTVLNGAQWIDPTGVDISQTGVQFAQQQGSEITLSALNVATAKGSVIDIRGGGDLYAYQWVAGTGGTVDVLAANTSFAVVPDYEAEYAPFAPFNPSYYSAAGVNNLLPQSAIGSLLDAGYANSQLRVGDRVFLDGGAGLPAGPYTLLPARYALLPGAFLMTPRPTSAIPPTQAVSNPDGSSIVAGYRTNSFSPTQPLYASFEVAPQSVVEARAEYDNFSGNSFFTHQAQATGAAVPRLPVDAGQVLLAATESMSLQGQVSAQPQTQADGTDLGRGGLVDIASSQDILVAGPAADLSAAQSDLVLNAAELSNFDTASLLIGGSRTTTSAGTTVIVTTNNLTIDNAGAPLTGSDIILAANQDLTVRPSSAIGGAGAPLTKADPLTVSDQVQLAAVGNGITLAQGGVPISLPQGTPGTDLLVATSAGTITRANGTTTRFSASDAKTSDPFTVPANSTITLDGAGILSFASSTDKVAQPIALVMGDGALLRVGSDPASTIVRANIAGSTAPNLAVGANVTFTGASAILDSTYATTIAPTVTWNRGAISLDSGQISIQLPGAGPLRTQSDGRVTSGLVLSGAALQALQNSASSLSLLPYSSLDLYGSGTIGTPGLASLALHTPEIFGDGGTVTFAADDVLLDNSSGRAAPDTNQPAPPPLAGTLAVTANSVRLGSNRVVIDQYANTNLNAAKQLLVQGAGGLSTQGNLAMATPQVAAELPPTQIASKPSTSDIAEAIVAGGALTVTTPDSGTPTPGGGQLGAGLTLTGQNVAVDSAISLPSGTLTLHANGSAATDGVSLGTHAALGVGGTAKTFNDLTAHTGGGNVTVLADNGSVSVGQGATIDVSAPSGGGSAGRLTVSAPNGALALSDGGKLLGQGGPDGLGGPDGSLGGTFALDVNAIPGKVAGTSSLAALGATLTAGGFTKSASLRIRTGDVVVDGPIAAHAVSIAADAGSITVADKATIDAAGATAASDGTVVDSAAKLADGSWKIDGKGNVVDASGNPVSLTGGTGGSIALAAAGSVTLDPGATLSAAGLNFDAAGKGGAVTLDAGSATLQGDGTYASGPNAVVDIQRGSTIDLSVASVNQSSNPNAVANAAARGQFTGTLHLRAPQNAAGTDLQVNPIAGMIVDPSSIMVEGYRTYVPAGGLIDTVEAAVKNDGATFAGGLDATGTLRSGHTAAIDARLLSGNPAAAAGLAPVLHLEPGAEIVNPADPTAATPLTLNPTSSSLAIPAGTSIAFLSGGAKLVFSSAGTVSGAAGTVTSPDGKTITPFTVATGATFAAGSTITLNDAGTVTLANSGALTLAAGSDAVTLDLPHGATYSANSIGAAGGATFEAGTGTAVTLKSAGNSALTVVAGVAVAFPNGTPGSDRLKSDQAGAIILPNGTSSAFSAGSSGLTVPAGGAVVLNAKGTLTYASGSSTTPLQVALTQGSYGASGAVDLTTSAGDLTLASTWDLSRYRFGPNANQVDPVTGRPITGSGEPGILTLRAAGNLVFAYNYDSAARAATVGSLSDGFDPTSALLATNTNAALWSAPFLSPGSRSWSYNLVAGADFGAAAAGQVEPLSVLPTNSGSIQLGLGWSTLQGNLSTRQNAIPANYQVIRTGTGDIDISAGRDVQLLNSLATIYTAGTQATVLPGFDVPQYASVGRTLAPQQPLYPAQYSMRGGDLTVTAQHDIAHELLNRATANISADSSKELPNNWLYRRGYVDPASGDFAPTHTGGEIASTSWWVDFSNFFEGIGALGGGNVALHAGNNVTNVDAVVPTNARMPGKDSDGNPIAPNAAGLLELGGGNLAVVAGNNISGGVYYVERGMGTLTAGNQIVTNATRAALPASALDGISSPDSSTWMPTTLFLGKASFNISAGGDLLLGPAANPFLQPEGLNNTYFDKSYFSTYAATDAINATSLTGTVTVKDSGQSLSNIGSASLFAWLDNVLGPPNPSFTSLASRQPWLGLDESSLILGSSNYFNTVSALMPGTLRVTAFTGDINLVGNITLSPAPTGTLDLVADGAINGYQPNALFNSYGSPSGSNPVLWAASVIDLSDANPASIPGVTTPFSLTALPSTTSLFSQAATWNRTPDNLFQSFPLLFSEGGSTTGTSAVLRTKQALHSPGLLHAKDATPAHLYAANGDISGLTLFSAKAARVVAGNDVTDLGFYVQNVAASDISVLAAGRDLTAYDPNTPLRLQGQRPGNAPLFATSATGDIQIAGPGTLVVLAGRNFDLGAGAVRPDGTGNGLTSIGNTANPYLPFAGADVVVGAGIGPAVGLDRSQLDFANFIAHFLDPATAGSQASELLPNLGQLMGLSSAPDGSAPSAADIWAAFNKLPVPEQDLLALDIFYLALRNAGRSHNDPQAPGFGNYDTGYEAIAALFDRRLDYSDATGTGFVDLFLNPATGGSEANTYLPRLAGLMGASGASDQQTWQSFSALPVAEQRALALQIFGAVLTDATAARKQPAMASAGKAIETRALTALFGHQQWQGDLSLASKLVESTNGGNISLFAPGGGLTLGYQLGAANQAPPGILTVFGGNISIFTNTSVNVGALRIFTLRGGNVIIWSSDGNIAAGRASKTVQAAPPTQVLVDPQSADVATDLQGLATGGGIGVLASVAGVPPGNVDLIAPLGAVDAGEAGIRASGNLNIAARVVLNASNIQVGGVSVGTPPPPAPPNIAPFTAASSAAAATTSAASAVAKQETTATQAQVTELPSIITVEIIGYGGGEEDNSGATSSNSGKEDDRRRRKQE